MEYTRYKPGFRRKVLDSYAKLKKDFEVVVIEGAGSPAEINLKSGDIVNMKMAQAAGSGVILVGDIDKGGVFAWLVGTLELLTKAERKRIKGIIINKFRGEKRLLESGIRFLEKKTGIKVLGVIPYFSASGRNDIRIPEEDSVALQAKTTATRKNALKTGLIDIAVVKLPHISNFTDFDSLENELDVRLRYAARKDDLNGPDVIIIPGTKNTIADLHWLKVCGIAEKILSAINHQPSTTLIGICGGYQMLGRMIYDIKKIEGKKGHIEGLGVLPVVTYFENKKVLSLVKAKALNSGLEVSGYEIHHGRSKDLQEPRPAFRIFQRQGKAAKDFDGTVSENQMIWGTYIHGIFDAHIFRRNFLNGLRSKKGLSPLPQGENINLDKEFDKLAALLRENIDMKLLYKILNHEPRPSYYGGIQIQEEERGEL